MNFGELIFQLPPPVKKNIRLIEKIRARIIDLNFSVSFNKICLQERLLPKYTNRRNPDPAARNQTHTIEHRRDLIQLQIQRAEDELPSQKAELQSAKNIWMNTIIDDDLRTRIDQSLDDLTNRHNFNTETRTIKKLTTLFGGPIAVPRPKEGFLNLADITLTDDQTTLLNMGLNCHVMTKPNNMAKKLELEILLDDIQELTTQNKVNTRDTLQTEILAESNKNRGNYRSTILSPELKAAAKTLRDNTDITIRRGDKSPIFVIMKKADYINKLNTILSDRTKFQRISRDTTADLKTKVNKLIETVNAKTTGIHLPKIIGEYKPGYIYGTVKTHKLGNPLRPIISQIPTPTYKLAKKLNTLLTPYVPATFSLKSPKEFIDILRTTQPTGIRCSLDVESLFTNVPVDDTIRMMMDKVYRDPTRKPIDIPECLLKKLLEACTKEAPFINPEGHMYKQIDGVAMGSPLGVLFANFYMGTIEQNTLINMNLKPDLYCRYIDDIFTQVPTIEHLHEIKTAFEQNSVLKFTYETEKDGKLPFLDVFVSTQNNSFLTTVYTKETNTGMCLNATSECPDRYKRSVVDAYVNRALTHCSNWKLVDSELNRIRQVLVNNGFTNGFVDNIIKKKVARHATTEDNNITPTIAPIKLYYRNYFSTAHKTDERVLQDIICRNVTPCDTNQKINLIIYYKNKKTANLLMKNSPDTEHNPLKETNVVYAFTCPLGDCQPQNMKYIGKTTTTLSRRLTMHKQQGSIREHLQTAHHQPITRDILTSNTGIIDRYSDNRRLNIGEALHIKQSRPAINNQLTMTYILPSARPRIIRPALNPVP